MQYSLKSPKKDSTAAKNYCFGLLKFRARSEREIRDRLRQHKFDNLIITPPPEMNFINDFDLWSHELKYLLSNLELVYTNDYNKDYVRPAI